jgi:hypothetical protein
LDLLCGATVIKPAFETIPGSVYLKSSEGLKRVEFRIMSRAEVQAWKAEEELSL